MNVCLAPTLSSSLKTAAVGTRVTEAITAMDDDPGLNGTLRFNLVQRIPDASFVSLVQYLCVYMYILCVHVFAHMYHAFIHSSLIHSSRANTLRLIP